MPATVALFKSSQLEELREIFFESSTRKSFSSNREREDFFYKYVGYYLKHYPELVFTATEERLLGYVLGTPDSIEHELLKIQPHLQSFEKCFSRFPAHLHINCHYSSRGRGVGALLVARFEAALRAKKVSGLHIMTSVDAKNKSFYHRLGYLEEVQEDYCGSKILLMGKLLSAE